MAGRRAIALGAALLALAAGGCMDPSIYQGTGASPAARRPPAATRSTARQQARPGTAAVATAPAGRPGGPTSNNVAIVVERIRSDARAATGGALAFRYADDRLVARSPTGRLARRNGIRVAVATKDLRVGLDASATRSRRSTRQSAFITVLSGQEGQILMGADTYVQRLGYWTPLGYRVLVERAFVGRSLVVRPTILPGGMVQVELWPRFSTRSRRGAIDVTELATKVVVRDGQPIVLGGSTTADDEVGAVLFGIGKRTRTATTTMVLTPRIGGLAIDWPKGRW